MASVKSRSAVGGTRGIKTFLLGRSNATLPISASKQSGLMRLRSASATAERMVNSSLLISLPINPSARNAPGDAIKRRSVSRCLASRPCLPETDLSARIGVACAASRLHDARAVGELTVDHERAS
jgi:hypothetical protein